MNALTFLNQPLLWGLALAAVPVLIHLLFRRRFRRVDWAPMRYLKLSIQRNRRRIRLEQLLLLLLRVAVVLLLFFAVARPVLHASGLGAWLTGSARSSQLLLIDTSLSMGYRDGGRSALERARELSLELVKTLSAKDRLTVVASSRPDEPLLREVEVAHRDQIASLINSLEPADAFTHWSATLEAVDALVSASTYPIRELTLITDLRRAGWDEKIDEVARRYASQRVKLRIFDVGSPHTENVALVDLVQIDRVPLAGAPARFEAVVHNGTSRNIEGLEASFSLDGKASAVRLPAIAPGATVRVPLAATFQTTGTHEALFRLADDPLPADNQRQAAIEVRDHVEILLVDGEPSSDPLGGEVDFLAVALAIGATEAETWRVDVKSDAEWSAAPLSNPDLLVLANLASVSPARANELRERVEQGMGLAIFVGDQIDLDLYNQTLYRGGNGTLPTAIESFVEEDVNGLILEDVAGSPLSALAQLKPAVLEQIKVRKYARVAWDKGASVRSTERQLRGSPQGTEVPEYEQDREHDQYPRVLARWNDAAASPAVLDKAIGRGRVLLWTLGADRAWSDWPTEPSYVLAMRESAAAIARASGAGRSLTAGEMLLRPLPEAATIESPTLELPGGDKPQPLPLPTSSSPALAYADTSRAGFYKLAWQQPPLRAQRDLFAINPDRRESALARIPHDELRSLFGALEPEIIAAVSAADTPIAIRGQEIWRTLAAALLVFLLVEACFATWVGRQR